MNQTTLLLRWLTIHKEILVTFKILKLSPHRDRNKYIRSGCIHKSYIHSSELFLVVLDQFKGRVTTRLTLLKTWSSLKANCKLVDGVFKSFMSSSIYCKDKTLSSSTLHLRKLMLQIYLVPLL